jgi:hypothetical protein
MKRALPAMFSKVDTLARLMVRSLPTLVVPGRDGAELLELTEAPLYGWLD